MRRDAAFWGEAEPSAYKGGYQKDCRHNCRTNDAERAKDFDDSVTACGVREIARNFDHGEFLFKMLIHAFSARLDVFVSVSGRAVHQAPQDSLNSRKLRTILVMPICS